MKPKMSDYPQPEHFHLYPIITTPGHVNFIFRTGMFKHFSFETHQFPLKASYIEIHKTALHRIPLLVHSEGGEYFIMVSANKEGQVQRKEYMVKRAILDLKEQFGWEVKVC